MSLQFWAGAGQWRRFHQLYWVERDAAGRLKNYKPEDWPHIERLADSQVELAEAFGYMGA